MTPSLHCFSVVGCRQEGAVAGTDGCAIEHGVAREKLVCLERCQLVVPVRVAPAAAGGPRGAAASPITPSSITRSATTTFLTGIGRSVLRGAGRPRPGWQP